MVKSSFFKEFSWGPQLTLPRQPDRNGFHAGDPLFGNIL